MNYVSSSPKQKALGWDGIIYRVSTTIAQYNMAGGIGTQYPITANPAIPNFGTSGSPSFGDAAEAYRPNLDFGDAPASYDPDALAPAVHDMISTLKLGSNQDLEWSKTSSVNADADGVDEDALPYVQLYSNTGTYLTEANVFNNTGANATLAAWADFNNNGIFESGEGITQTIATSTTQQTINLFWSGISEVIPDGSYIYLRIRITSASNAMGLSNATGYFSNGEVEDYRVLVTFTPLAVRVTDFKVTKISEEKVEIKWTSVDDEMHTRYDVERSFDGRNWVTIHSISANNDHHSVRYTYTDPNPLKPTSFYRVKYSKANTQLHFTPIQKVNFNWFHSLNVFPNPVTKIAFARFITMEDLQIQLSLVDVTGSLHHSQNYQVRKGENTIALLFVEQLPAGRYTLQLKIKNETQTQQIVINR